jgi:hypothetical protein
MIQQVTSRMPSIMPEKDPRTITNFEMQEGFSNIMKFQQLLPTLGAIFRNKNLP